MTLEEAKAYISYGIKEGYYEQDQFDARTEADLIEFAQHEMGRAEAYWEGQNEN